MDFKQLNETLIQFLEDIRTNIDYDSSIACKLYNIYDQNNNLIEKGYIQIKSGTAFYRFEFRDSENKDLLLSKQVTEYLKEVSTEYNGFGQVSAIMDSHSGTPSKPSTHPSGNCIDFGLAWLGKNIIKIADSCEALLKHQATMWLYLESNSYNDEPLANGIIKELQNRQINTDKCKFRQITWATGFHIHLQINPYLLKQKPVTWKEYGL